MPKTVTLEALRQARIRIWMINSLRYVHNISPKPSEHFLSCKHPKQMVQIQNSDPDKHQNSHLNLVMLQNEVEIHLTYFE